MSDTPPPVNDFAAEVYRKRTVMRMIDCKPEAFRQEFTEWLAQNYAVWEAFEYQANSIWKRGIQRWSARTIGEYLRHETAIAETPRKEFKLNDHYWPDLARLYMMMHPDRDKFFELRIGQSAVRAA